MKILIFSDSHGDISRMERAVEEERPDRVFHLGDVTGDARRLRARFPELPIDQVRGNCDGGEDSAPLEREVLLEGKRLWLLHGHSYHVKLGVGMLLGEARARGVDAVFFGHTHQSLCTLEGSTWGVNPGCCRSYPRPTCAVAEIQKGTLTCRILELK